MERPTILIVDDDEVLLSCLKDFLEGEGYRAFTALDGMMAIQLAKAHKPSLILMDFNMPLIDGLQALEILRQDPALCRIPVIMLTGASSGLVYPAIESMHNISHLKKPASLQDVHSLIQHYLAA